MAKIVTPLASIVTTTAPRVAEMSQCDRKNPNARKDARTRVAIPTQVRRLPSQIEQKKFRAQNNLQQCGAPDLKNA